MSNDNRYERLWKLQAKANMLILDDKRDIDVLLGFYQRFLEASSFNPATFIGKGWSYYEARDPRSASLVLIDDYSQVKMSTNWLAGKTSVDGETRRRRILEDQSSIPLNCDHFLYLWNNKKKIPKSWEKVGAVTFDGDVLRHSDGPSRRYVLYLYWIDGRWFWSASWLDNGWDDYSPSAVLAS